MAGVINDVEALAEFRIRLIQFNRELAESFAAIRGHWLELGDVWRDDMYRLFGEALEEVTPGIEVYLSATEAHEAHLAALIEQLQAYLDTGLVVTQRDHGTGRDRTGRAGGPREQGRRDPSRR